MEGRLQMAAVGGISVASCAALRSLPAHTGKVEGNLRENGGPGGVLIALNILERRDEGLVVRGDGDTNKWDNRKSAARGDEEAPHQGR